MQPMTLITKPSYVFNLYAETKKPNESMHFYTLHRSLFSDDWAVHYAINLDMCVQLLARGKDFKFISDFMSCPVGMLAVISKQYKSEINKSRKVYLRINDQHRM